MDSRAAAYRNLHLMLGAGLPVIQAFRHAGRGRGPVARAMGKVSEQLRSGQQIGEAMAAHPSVFGPLDRAVVRAAEESGDLPGALAMLAQWYEFRQRLKARVRSDMLLPLMVLHAMALLLPMISVFTAATGGGSIEFERIPWLFLRNLAMIWAPLLAIWGIFHYAPAQGALRRGLDRLLLSIPLLGGAMRQLALSRYFWAYHMLAKAGLDAVRTTQMAAEVAGNAVVAGRLEAGTQSARQGHPVSEGLRGAIPQEYLEILEVGEQTGEPEDSARRLAEIASERAAGRLHALAVWVPRIVYLCILIYGAYVVVNFYDRTLGSALNDASRMP